MDETADDARPIEVVEQFGAARGDRADESWALTAMWCLLRADVAPGEVRRSLEEALLLTRQSGESPQELYGEPEAWARDLVQQWRAEGRPVSAPGDRVRLRDLVVDGLANAALLSVLFMVVLLVRDGATIDYTVGLLVLPVGLAVTSFAVLVVWSRVLVSRARGVAVVAAAAVGLAGTMAIGGAIWLGHDRVVVRASPAWLCVAAAAYAALSVVCDRVLPRPERTTHTPALADEDWKRSLAGVLREKAGLPEPRVQSILTEASTHADAAGESLEHEFGRPEAYAAQFTPDLTAKHRRMALLFAALAGLGAILVFGAGSGWTGLVLTASFGGLAVREALRSRAVRPARR